METPEKLLRPHEAAELLGLRVSTIYAWARAHRLPVQYLDGLVRFSQRALSRWLRRQHVRSMWPGERLPTIGEEPDPDNPPGDAPSGSDAGGAP